MSEDRKWGKCLVGIGSWEEGYSETVCMNNSIRVAGFSSRRFRKTCMSHHQGDRRHGKCKLAHVNAQFCFPVRGAMEKWKD